MRLFYLITFLVFSMHIAGYALQEKQVDFTRKDSKISFISSKKQTKFLSDFGQDSESLQKDFINTSLVKTCCNIFLLLTLLTYGLWKRNASGVKAEIKRLKLNYYCLFKQLYPKHVFW